MLKVELFGFFGGWRAWRLVCCGESGSLVAKHWVVLSLWCVGVWLLLCR